MQFAHLAKDRFQGEPTTQFPVNSCVLVQETLTHRSDPKRKSSMELKSVGKVTTPMKTLKGVENNAQYHCITYLCNECRTCKTCSTEHK